MIFSSPSQESYTREGMIAGYRSLTKTAVPPLSQPKRAASGEKQGEMAVFAGYSRLRK